MKFRIFPRISEEKHPDTPPNQLGEVIEVAGHLYVEGDIHIRAIYPAASPIMIVTEEEFEIEECLDKGCKHLVPKKEESKMSVKMHFCPSCGRQMIKVQGTKGTYECKKCGIQVNPYRKSTLGDLINEAGH